MADVNKMIRELRRIRELIESAAELLAMIDDVEDRKDFVKGAQRTLAKLTRERRKAGHYPGGTYSYVPHLMPTRH